MRLRIGGVILTAREGLGERKVGVPQDVKRAAAGRGARGCFGLSVSEGSSDGFTCEPGQKAVNFDMSGITTSVNMEVLKVSRPIVSAGMIVRSGRMIILDEPNSHIENKEIGKIILLN